MKILLVEDNESIINGLVFLFKEENLNLDYKKNVKDTIEYLKTTTPDLIILDTALELKILSNRQRASFSRLKKRKNKHRRRRTIKNYLRPKMASRSGN